MKKRARKKCCVKDCTEVCLVVHSKLMDSDETKSLLASTSLQFENDIIPFPTPLCAQHYHVAYSAIQPIQPMLKRQIPCYGYMPGEQIVTQY